MADAEEFRKIKQDWIASRDARAVTVGQMLQSFRENITVFRKENSESTTALEKTLADFRFKSQGITKQIASLAEQTATFILESNQNDQDRARQVYQLFEELTRMLQEFLVENEKCADEITKLFASFGEQDAGKKDEIAELCRTGFGFLERLSRRRHERKEDVQVVLGQLRLENRERLDWIASMLAKLRADERDRSQEFEGKDAKVCRDVRSIIEQFRKDREEANNAWNELKSAIELVQAGVPGGRKSEGGE